MIPKFLLDSEELFFDKESHSYKTNACSEFISVTQFIDKYSNPFDENGDILRRCAEKEGITPKELKKRWNDKGLKARMEGTKFHASVEHFIKTSQIKDDENKDLIEHFSKHRFKGRLFSEVKLFLPEASIAGTCDVLELKNNTICCKDFKRMEKRPNSFGFNKYLKYPINHLSDSKLSKYSIQISIYLYILKYRYGYKVGTDNCIFWVDAKNRKVEKIPVEYMEEEVITMISHWLNKDDNSDLDGLIGKSTQNVKDDFFD